jgi:plastocyanin
LFGAAALASCSSSTTDVSQPSGRNLLANQISIVVGASTKGTAAFTPNPLSISLANSGVVRWFNDDQTQSGAYGSTGTTHNITADDGSFTSGPLAPGTSFDATFSLAGTFTYHCSIHPTMKGTVTVAP